MAASPGARRLGTYLVGLALLLGGAEGLVRGREADFEAAAHRARFKARLVRAQEHLDWVAVGTSRLNDGLSPAALPGRGFNASVPSSSLQAQAFLAEAALARGDVRLLLLELSGPQLMRPDDAELAPGPAAALADLEGRLLASSHLVTWRRALVLENLPRLFALAAPRGYDGSEWFRTRWLLERWRPGHVPTPPLDAPTVRCGAPGGAPADYRPAVEAWVALARRARERGVAVRFLAPPLAEARRDEACGPTWQGTWDEVAAATGAPVWDFGCAAAQTLLFHDGHDHLSYEGRLALNARLAPLVEAALRGETGCPEAAP